MTAKASHEDRRDDGRGPASSTADSVATTPRGPLTPDQWPLSYERPTGAAAADDTDARQLAAVDALYAPRPGSSSAWSAPLRVGFRHAGAVTMPQPYYEWLRANSLVDEFERWWALRDGTESANDALLSFADSHSPRTA